jgi:dephospho-CoA kinase
MHRIGLTGGFCSGKTFVLKVLEEQGCRTLRADDLAKAIVFAPGSPLLAEVVGIFGPGVLDAAGGLDKEQFSQALFADLEKRRALNAVVHPLVGEERRRLIREAEAAGIYDFLVYESALLLESGIQGDFERVIVVYSSPAVQLRRAMERDGLTRAEAQKRIRSQFPLREKLKAAHYAIDTSLDAESTRARTLEVFHLLQKDFHLT